MNMNWNYIAGFLDGEGSIVKHKNTYRITISQANKKILEEIKNFTKVGHIYEITKRKKHWKDAWIYTIIKQKDILEFLKKIKPKLFIKKDLATQGIKKIKNNLKIIEEKKLKRTANIKKIAKLRKEGLSWRMIGKKLPISFRWAHLLYTSSLS